MSVIMVTVKPFLYSYIVLVLISVYVIALQSICANVIWDVRFSGIANDDTRKFIAMFSCKMKVTERGAAALTTA